VDDRAQVQWTPELSMLEFQPQGSGGEHYDEETAAQAWIQGPSPAAVTLRERARGLARGGFGTALLCGEPGTGKHRVAQWIHGHCVRADRPLAIVDGSSPTVHTQVAHLRSSLRTGQGLIPGNVVVREIHRTDPRVVEQLGELPGWDAASAPCGLLLLTTESPTRLRTLSPEHGRVVDAASAIVDVPALRERRADIGILASGFLTEAAARYGRSVRGISSQAQGLLEQHAFPGNLRELACVIEQAVLRCNGDWLTAECLRGLLSATEEPASRAEIVIRLPGSSLREIELQALKLALKLTGGRVVRASELLGITRHALRRKIEKFGLEEMRHPGRDDDFGGSAI
jgi:DNA-binding NtrC family response regulator